jgi:hypothetical protein
VEFHSGVIGAGQTPTAQTARWHPEISAVLLRHYVCRHFRGAEQRMLRLVYRKRLWDSVLVVRIVVIPSSLKLAKTYCVRQISVDFIGRHVDEGRLRAGATRSFQKIQRADSIRVKVVEWNRSRAVVGRLCGRVNNRIRFDVRNEPQNALAVANIDVKVCVLGEVGLQTLQGPARVPLRSEENSPLVVVNAKNAETMATEMEADLGSYESARARDNSAFYRHDKPILQNTRVSSRWHSLTCQ